MAYMLPAAGERGGGGVDGSSDYVIWKGLKGIF